MENVKIIPKLNGWVVIVGCSSVVFVDKKKMLSEIGRYIASPDEVAKEYVSKAVNKSSSNTAPGRAVVGDSGAQWTVRTTAVAEDD